LRQAYLRLRSASVFPRSGLVMPEQGVVLRNDLHEWVHDHRLTPGFVDFVDGSVVARARDLRHSQRIHQTALVLCHAFEHNYGHWLLDCLPRLLPWVRLLQEKRLVMLVRPLADWQRRTLELLDVPAAAVKEVHEPSILCDDIIVPGLQTMNDTQPMLPPTVYLRPPACIVIATIKLLQEKVVATATIVQPERIYVSRRGISSFRALYNEHEVETAMTRLGFNILQPETLPFEHQVSVFSCAQIIAGLHGAGLTNAVFAPKDCLVVDLLPDTWHTKWVLRVTQVFEHNYLPIVYACDPALSKPVMLGSAVIDNMHVLKVPADALVDLLAGAIRGLER